MSASARLRAGDSANLAISSSSYDTQGRGASFFRPRHLGDTCDLIRFAAPLRGVIALPGHDAEAIHLAPLLQLPSEVRERGLSEARRRRADVHLVHRRETGGTNLLLSA